MHANINFIMEYLLLQAAKTDEHAVTEAELTETSKI